MEVYMRTFGAVFFFMVFISSSALACDCQSGGISFQYKTVEETDIEWMEEFYWDVKSFQLNETGTCVVSVNLVAGDHPAIDTLILDQPGEDNWDDQIFAFGQWMLTDDFEAEVRAQDCTDQIS
jgi:hypothetical protein